MSRDQFINFNNVSQLITLLHMEYSLTLMTTGYLIALTAKAALKIQQEVEFET